MPSPFNLPSSELQRSVEQELVEVTNSCLTCEFCFNDSENGTYDPKRKELLWVCYTCKRENVVKGIEI